MTFYRLQWLSVQLWCQPCELWQVFKPLFFLCSVETPWVPTLHGSAAKTCNYLGIRPHWGHSPYSPLPPSSSQEEAQYGILLWLELWGHQVFPFINTTMLEEQLTDPLACSCTWHTHLDSRSSQWCPDLQLHWASKEPLGGRVEIATASPLDWAKEYFGSELHLSRTTLVKPTDPVSVLPNRHRGGHQPSFNYLCSWVCRSVVWTRYPRMSGSSAGRTEKTGEWIGGFSIHI